MIPDEIAELVAMHRYRRPAFSVTEREFCAAYLDNLPGVWTDERGNRVGQIGPAPRVLWSSHTDTVHKKGGRQRLMWGDNMLSLHPDDADGGCLGADCTVGVWIMRQMYKAGVPGLYVWHADEEAGRNGAEYFADAHSDMLEGVQCAIAFDRRGTSSIVTHQMGGRTASEAFALSLAEQLGGKYAPDDGGSYTDTLAYAGLVPECTNISVGYYSAHTSAETLNTAHAAWLLGRMLQVDAAALVIERTPAEVDDWFRGGGWSTVDDRAPRGSSSVIEDIADLIWERPQEVASLLIALGYSRSGLERDLADLAGEVYRPGDLRDPYAEAEAEDDDGRGFRQRAYAGR